ncbi:hypothetical protein BGX24_000177 [Mortierella sp. AD032]|nr:hypothetical protein BGX24_000177 [Mortierella sp. AD032]
MSYALIADRILRKHAQGIQRGGDEEEDSAVVDAVLAAGESAPLRTLYMAIKLATSQQRNADKSDDSIQRSRVARKYTPVAREWTLEDDTLLKRLVQEHIDVPEPSIWHKVSGGTIDGAILLRTVPSCVRRWRVLYPPPLGQTGRWLVEEELRLQEAISEQFEGKYQVLVDVMLNKDLAQTKEKQMRSPVMRNLQQLPSQSSLPILKPGSRRLRMLNWVMIAEKVQSRNDYECREHFHSTYHNGNRGTWSEGELKRAKEGFEMFGSNSRKVAEYVGTRSPTQVSRLHSNLRFKENKQKLEALEDT